MSTKHKNLAAPIKGLWLDTPKNVQPEGTYSYALNATSVSEEGEEGIISNEIGNTAKFSIASNYNILGHLAMSDGYTVIASIVEPDGRGFGTYSEIGLQTPEGEYEQLIRSTDLDFSKYFQIQIETALLNGCDRVIYFNTPTLYAINIDNLDQYLLTGETVATANADGAGWDVSLMKLFTPYTAPTISEITVNDTGGDLPLGTYFAIIQYMDASRNGTGWMTFTHAIPILDESLSSEFNLIDGGLNSTSPGSNKSITLTIEGLDPSFPYYQVGVIASNDDVRTGYLFEEVPLTGDTSTYTISSLSFGEEVPLTSFTVERAIYTETETLTQKDSRLVLGNVKEKVIDHALFQQTVNEYKTNWFSKQYRATDMSNQTSYKSPEAFYEFRGHPRDEVIALGVRFRFKDGYISPVYHIPGRERNVGNMLYTGSTTLPANYEINTSHNRPVPIDGWDTSLYTVTTSTTPAATEVYIGDVDFLGFTDANYTTFDCGDGVGVVARWRFCNTAVMEPTGTGLVDETNYREGEMAYWESSLTYPDSVDCDGNRVFPEGNIRHHKLPDATLHFHSETVADVEYTYPLGIRVYDIDIPAGYADEIDGIQIVRVKRDGTNSSVLDGGLFSRVNILDDGTSVYMHQPSVYNGNAEWGTTDIVGENYAHGLHTPKLKFLRNRLGASYIKYDAVIVGNVDYNLIDTGPTPDRYASSVELVYNSSPRGSISMNRGITTQAFVDPDSWLYGVFDINGTTYDFNNTEQQEVFISTFSHRGTGPYLGVQTDAVLDVLNYYSGQDSPDYPTMFYYGTVKKYLPQQYGSLSSNLYVALNADFQGVASSISDFGGDVFVSKLYTRRTFLSISGEPVNHDESPTRLDRGMWGFYCESQINCGYRHTGEEAYETYYPKETLFTAQMIERYTSDDPTDIANEYLDLIPNYYAINNDYLQENAWKVYVPLSATFDYCANCEGEYKTRMPYSEVKANEGTIDSYRIFLSNNYRDLPSNTGEISNLFVVDDKLYAHTAGSLWMVPTSPQQFQGSDATVYIGTGDFMGVTPIEVKSIKGGYLGSKQKFATIITEYGTSFISRDRMFLLGPSGLEEISRSGFRQFFLDNTLQYGLDVYDLTEQHFEETCNTSSGSLVGFISAYDPRKHRLLIHKKDYRILPAFEEVYAGLKDRTISYEVGDIVYDTDNQVFQEILSKTTVGDAFLYTYDDILLTDTEYFQDISYTLSYDLQNKHWVSFHSYLPNYMYHTANKMYSFINTDNEVYEHAGSTYQKFHGSNYDHILEFTLTDTPMLANVTKSIGYISKTRQYDSTPAQNKISKAKTFTDVWVYNDAQSSGKLAIDLPASPYNPADYIAHSSTSVRVENKEGVWKFNGIRNYIPASNTSAISTTAWEDIQTIYPIDKIPYVAAHDTAKSQYELDKFRDMYVSVRLYNTFPTQPQDNYELITQYMYSNAKYSNR